MKLFVSLEPDYKGAVHIIDATYGSPDADGYIDEDYNYNDGITWQNFKWSDTCTINVIKKITSKTVESDPVFTMHKIGTGDNYELISSDSIRYIIKEDGYYTVDHIVLPTIYSEWFQKVKEIADNATGIGDINNDSKVNSEDVSLLNKHIEDQDEYDPKYDINKDGEVNDVDTIAMYEIMNGRLPSVNGENISNHKIYLTDGENVYLYSFNALAGKYQLNVVNLEEVISVGQYSQLDNISGSETISMNSFSVFCIDRLRDCYQKVAVDILNHMSRCNEYYEKKKFIRDFLWMTINVIDIYVQENLYTNAQVVLEKFQSYGNSYPITENYNTSGCGCRS